MEVVLLVVRGHHVMAGVVLFLLLLFIILILALSASIRTTRADLLQSFIATGGLSLVGLLES